MLFLHSTLFAQQVIRRMPMMFYDSQVEYKQDKDVIKDLFDQRRNELEIQVDMVTLVLKRSFVFGDGFDSNLRVKESDLPLTYRGYVKGYENSRASVTIYGDKINGSYSYDNMNFFFSPEEQLYNALPAMNKPFDCKADDLSPTVEIPKRINSSGTLPCVGLRLEVDKDVYDKFKTDGNLAGFITGVFNEVFYLFEREGITMYLNEIIVHKGQEKYPCRDSYDCLKLVGENVKGGIKGDLTQLWKLSSNASGGIAWKPGLCSRIPSYRTSYAGIEANYKIFPNYSWTVMVAAHEIGHNLGSDHTHACAWNGNNTAIDGCWNVEGNCGDPGNPQEGGTVMSYCHLTSAGINFNLGFGPQPGERMRNYLANASCMDDKCSPEDNCVDIEIEVKYDYYPQEIYWAIIDENNKVVEQGHNPGKEFGGTTFNKTICLPKGCYRVDLSDTEGDGLESYILDCLIEGYFRVKEGSKDHIKTSYWGKSKSYNICIGEEIQADCSYINFDTKKIYSYTIQDRGKYEAAGNQIIVYDNAWKAIDFPYNVTRKTVIEFEFYSTTKGEIHAIGLDTNLTKLNPLRSIQVYGSQIWGYQYNNDYTSGWKKYVVNIGEQYFNYKKNFIGPMKYMFFMADHDVAAAKRGDSFFRNIKVYENGDCESEDLVDFMWHSSIQNDSKFIIIPNPADNTITLSGADYGDFKLFDINGKSRMSVYYDGSDIDVSDLSKGLYFARINENWQKLVIN